MNNLEIAKIAAFEAWKEVMKIYNWNFDVEIKEDSSPITVADKKANEIIINELSKTWISILSEESFDNLDRLNKDYLWIIDPIDWTKDFINKTWEFSIMIWLVENWEPILWVVYLPVNDKMYYAEKGSWSFLEINWVTNKLNCSDKSEELTILMSRNHTSNEEQLLIDELDIKQLKCWSIGVKLWLIAEQKWELYLNFSDKTKEWDTCAPEIILKEAWWIITDIYGSKLDYNNEDVRRNNWILASNWVIHDIIKWKIEEYKN